MATMLVSGLETLNNHSSEEVGEMVKNYMQKLRDSLYKHEGELEKGEVSIFAAMTKFRAHLEKYKEELQIDKNFIL